MSWFLKLYETYEACMKRPELVGGEFPLVPVSHTTPQVHIRIVIDAHGNFLRAEHRGKEPTIIPSTEKSAGRVGNEAPHPLADKVHVCAEDYVGDKPNHFVAYKKELGDWCKSTHSHPKAQAVYAYITKGKVAEDLVNAGILQADAAGKLLTNPPEENPSPVFKVLQTKNGKKDQGDAMICWTVEIPGDAYPDTWQDKTLHQSWITYNAESMQNRGLCMATGADHPLASQHPRNLRRPGDGAKLISSNDTSGFTFRGKFDVAGEASTVGYEITQKAHNALRWLIVRQGYRNGDQVIVSWAVKNPDIPAPLNDVVSDQDVFDDMLSEELREEESHNFEEKAVRDDTRDLGQLFSIQLKKALQGYRGILEASDTVVILGLDSATPGRLSITFYREIFWSDYLDRLRSWQEDCAWLLRRSIEKEEEGKKPRRVTKRRVSAPTPLEICYAAYGMRVDDKLKKNTIERLLPCITDVAPIPRDLLENCIRRSCNRAGLESWEWETTLGVTCGLFKAFYLRHPQQEKRRKYNMALDENIRSRDYLFGRLLAVAEYAERSALNASNEKRPTNAERLMQRFSDQPCATWLNLEKQLGPYMQRLQSTEKTWWIYNRSKKLMMAISDLFLTPEDFSSNERLSGEFLLGYHCQMSALYKKTEKINDNNDNVQTGSDGGKG